MILGIIAGLGTATCQSVSYLLSRQFIQKNGSSFQLLVVSHMVMGGFAIVIMAALLLRVELPHFNVYLLPLLQCNAYYLLGQMAFFLALKKTEASRVSPLLGMKIIFIAIISTLFYTTHFNGMQLTALVLCLAGAVISNWSGGSLSWRSLTWIMLACIGYSLSDINIKLLISSLGEPDIAIAAVLAGTMSYTVNGILATTVFFSSSKISKRLIIPALPFCIFWFAAMLLLFYCFGLIGPVLGNIVQSTRGVISVIIGVVVAKIGFSDLESRLTLPVVIKRIIAAMLITAAIILFSLEKLP